MTNQLIIASTPIPVDSDDRINLNALHRASGLGESKEPNKWLKLKSTQSLVSELEATEESFGRVINSIKGGNAPGTFAHQLLAISYAGWISPAFQLQVNQVFLHSKSQMVAAEPQLAQSDMVINKDKYIHLLEQTLELLQIEERKAQQKPKRKPSTPLSDEEVNCIHKLSANGLSQSDIAKTLNRSNATVSFVLRSNNLQGGEV